MNIYELRSKKFPDEAKRMLQLEPIDRTDDMIRFITISLNFCVPEFFSVNFSFIEHSKRFLIVYEFLVSC
jgi:hypothetical protein